MSVHALNDETRRIILPDELESIFHVLLYVAVRFLPHNLPDQDVGQFLYDYFDGYSFYSSGVRCGWAKRHAMNSGEISLQSYNGDQDRNNETLRFGIVPPMPPLLPLPPSVTTGRQTTPQPSSAPPAEPAAHSSGSHSPVPGSSSARAPDMTAPSQNHPLPANDNPSPLAPSQLTSSEIPKKSATSAADIADDCR